MLGSLTLYRRLLRENVFCLPQVRAWTPGADPIRPDERGLPKLPSFGHGIAGAMAGFTVSFVAAPVEHIKSRLQIQYAAKKADRLYSGPIDCTRKIVRRPPFPCSSALADFLRNRSFTRMGYEAFIADCGLQVSFVDSSSSGGARTRSSPVD